MRTTHRIDVHQHVVPPFWAKALPNHGGDPSGPRSGDPSSTVLPQWSPEDAIDLMDSQEIATGILSLTAPGIVGWDQRARREMARRVNEYTADLVAKRPDRFGHFATVPLPDVDGALSELEYALDTLRADGVILLGNHAEKYLGDATLEPLWAELHSRLAVVFVHPGLPLTPAVGVAGPLVDYPFDTTRTQLVLNGIVDRYPRARIILAHAGGFVPFASHRFARQIRALEHWIGADLQSVSHPVMLTEAGRRSDWWQKKSSAYGSRDDLLYQQRTPSSYRNLGFINSGNVLLSHNL